MGTEKLTGEGGQTIDALKDADIKNADMIMRVNGAELHTVERYREKVDVDIQPIKIVDVKGSK